MKARARTILVLGATGRFGQIVDLLVARGHQVRAGTRDPNAAAAARLRELGAEVVRADFDDPASIESAAHGVEAVFASGTAHKAGADGETQHGVNLADALVAAGAPRLVFVSGADADRPTGVPVLEAKRTVERRLAQHSLPVTLLAPVYLMENLFNPWNLGMLRSGRLPTPIPPSEPLQQVPVADVLAVAVAAIERPDELLGQRIELASDSPTGEEATRALSRLLGVRSVGAAAGPHRPSSRPRDAVRMARAGAGSGRDPCPPPRLRRGRVARFRELGLELRRVRAAMPLCGFD